MPLARGAGIVALLLLLAQQVVGDGGATLLGTVAGAVLAQTAGHRPTLVVGALAMFAGALALRTSPRVERAGTVTFGRGLAFAA